MAVTTWRSAAALMVALSGLAAASGPVNAYPQRASAPAVKAAFLYNFAKFAEWPPEALPPGTPLVLCVVDDHALVRALDEATAGRSVSGHGFVVRKIDADGPVTACHLLYVNGLDTRMAVALVQRLDGQPILSVSEFSDFARMGGVASLFAEDGRMRFAINVDSTRRSRIRLSSQLLRLAAIVNDEETANGR
jgi:hypothetical protein